MTDSPPPAVQWTGTNHQELRTFTLRPDHHVPAFTLDLINAKAGRLDTARGVLTVKPGDWVVQFQPGVFAVLTPEQYESLPTD